MIAKMLKRPVGSWASVFKILQGMIGLVAAFVFVVGFLRVTALELTEAQLFLGLGVLFTLVLQLWILWALIDLKRNAA